MAGSPLPFLLSLQPPEKATVVRVKAVLGFPDQLEWTFDPTPLDSLFPPDPRPSLMALTIFGWRSPFASAPFVGNSVIVAYPAALLPGAAVRILSQPLTFFWPDRILRIPFRGNALPL